MITYSKPGEKHQHTNYHIFTAGDRIPCKKPQMGLESVSSRGFLVRSHRWDWSQLAPGICESPMVPYFENIIQDTKGGSQGMVNPSSVEDPAMVSSIATAVGQDPLIGT